MVFHGARIHDVKRLLPTLDSFANKREEYAVLFIRGMKKRTNMTLVPVCRVSKMNRLLAAGHQFSPMVICVCKRAFLVPPMANEAPALKAPPVFPQPTYESSEAGTGPTQISTRSNAHSRPAPEIGRAHA